MQGNSVMSHWQSGSLINLACNITLLEFLDDDTVLPSEFCHNKNTFERTKIS
jgi:hypothetical protein